MTGEVWRGQPPPSQPHPPNQCGEPLGHQSIYRAPLRCRCIVRQNLSPNAANGVAHIITGAGRMFHSPRKVLSIFFFKNFTRRVKFLKKKKENYRCEKALWSDRVTPVNSKLH